LDLRAIIFLMEANSPTLKGNLMSQGVQSNSALLTDTEPHSIKWTPRPNTLGRLARGKRGAPLGCG
jgi:hypothetical protein